MCAELAILNHCAVPFSCCAAANLCWYYYIIYIIYIIYIPHYQEPDYQEPHIRFHIGNIGRLVLPPTTISALGPLKSYSQLRRVVKPIISLMFRYKQFLYSI